MISNWTQLASYKVDADKITADNPEPDAWLLNCIRANQRTVYGKKYCFEKIYTIDQYCQYVPLINYEDIQNYIRQISGGEKDILFKGKAVAFERSSGSSGAEKLIPYSSESLNNFRKIILPWLSGLARAHNIQTGSVYWAISPATRQAEMTDGGVPIGLSDADYIGADLLTWFSGVSAVPLWVGGIANVPDWQLATLYYLLCHKDLALVSVWSPSFLLQLLEALQTRQHELLRLLQKGGEIDGRALPPDLSAAARCQAYFQGEDARCLWPDLRVISCWADASSAFFYQRLRSRFKEAHFQPKGLLATEGIVTAPDSGDRPRLVSDSGFFEFEEDNGELRLTRELQEGRRYEVIMTTAGGLYRYRTGDLVLCEKAHPAHPVLRFVGKGDLVSDMVGEKLTDEFVRSCLQELEGFGMLVPVNQEKPHYILILDKDTTDWSASLVERMEKRLFANRHYAYARKLGQLGRLQALTVARPLHRYTDSRLRKGARLGDIKVPSLCIYTDWLKKNGSFV